MKSYKVCIVGAGAVGKEMIRLLRKRNFPAESIVILARSTRNEEIDGEIYLLEQIEIITLCSPLELDAKLFWTPPRRDQESPGYGTAILILNNAGKEKRPRRKAEPFSESRNSKAFAALYAVIYFEFHRMRSMF